MYSMRNIINSAEDIEIPENIKMYKMRTYDGNTSTLSKSSQTTLASTISTSNFSGKCSAAEEALIKRQENVLLQLQSCLRDVEDINIKLDAINHVNMKQDSILNIYNLNNGMTMMDGIESVPMTQSEDMKEVSKIVMAGTAVMEPPPSSMVISINPNELQLSIISLILYLNAQLSAGVSIHIHSSVQNLPGPGLKLLELLKSIDNENPQFRITLILRNVESPELMVSATKQRAKVRGEAPIARYLSSFTALRPSSPAEDAWLDRARTASAEDVSSGLKQSGAKCLCGDEPSLADVVVLSSLCRRRVSRRSVAAWEKLLKNSAYFKQLTALF